MAMTLLCVDQHNLNQVPKLCPPKTLLDEIVTSCAAVTCSLRNVDLGSWFKGIQTIMVEKAQ